MKLTKARLKQIIKEELKGVNPHSDFYEQGSIHRGYDDLLSDSDLKSKVQQLALSIVDEYKDKPGFNISSAREAILEEIAAMIELDVMLHEEFPGEEAAEGYGP